MKTKAYRPVPTISLDVCEHCRGLWFDSGEISPTLSPHTDGFKLKMPSEELPDLRDGQFSLPHFILGLPSEENVVAINKWPAATVSLIAISFLVTALCVKNPENILKLAFFPDDPLANYGRNLLTSIFAHAGWMHMITNGYFLFLCGDNVEELLGSWSFVELFFLGSIAGHITSMFYGLPLPVVGCDSAMFAIFSFYAVAFPKNKLLWSLAARTGPVRSHGIGTRRTFDTPAVAFSPITFMIIYFLMSVTVLSWASLLSWTWINHVGKLSGILVGLVFFELTQDSHIRHRRM